MLNGPTTRSSMTDPLPELALTEEEIDEILHTCADEALLVGGQALNVWAQHFEIPMSNHVAAATADADFLGSADVARKLADALKTQGWQLWQPTMDDATTQTAKLSKKVADQGIKQIDFLSQLTGLDANRVRRRAASLNLADGTPLKVMHPLDVLESRLYNLARLPRKRTPQGVAQARLSIEVIARYLESRVEEGDPRPLLKAIEQVVRVAQDRQLSVVFHDYDLDPLTAVPVDRVPSEEFRTRRWPHVCAQTAAQREAYAKRRASKTKPVCGA